MAEREVDFLRRWSRRKAQARRAGRSPKPDDGASATDASEPAAATPAVAEPGAREAGEPDVFDETEIEALTYESDYTRFLKAGVPAAIQRKALRRLWASNPIFGTHDGLDDYYVTEDFTDAARAAPNIASSWRPGAGYKTDAELSAETEARKAQEVAETPERQAHQADAARDRDLASQSESGDADSAQERERPDDSATAGDNSDRQERDAPSRA